LKVDDLGGSLITYESIRFQHKKKKKFAFRSSKKYKEVVVESPDEEFSNLEVLSLLTRNFHKFLKSCRRSNMISSTIYSKGDSHSDSHAWQEY
jgi:hypothetical protein